jgi:DNA adenine methylase
MIADTTIKRPALRYYGGKWNLAPWIISYFPPHKNYVEPCGGAASVLLQKPRSPLETYNDLDGNVVNFFRVLRDRPDELIRKIRLTPYSREEFCEARAELKDPDPIEWARKLFLFSHQSYSGVEKWPGWSLSNPNGWADLASLENFAARFNGVLIEKDDAIAVIQRYGGAYDCLIYFDPPYVDETRERPNRYLTDAPGPDLHTESAEILRAHKGFAIVSGYACPLYEDLYEAHGWKRIDRVSQTNSGGKRVESLWLNPRTVEAQSQKSLFEVCA